jgi:hypothetical protein
MKIDKIQQGEREDLFIVTFKPNWIERLVGYKEYIEEFKFVGLYQFCGYIRKSDGANFKETSTIGEKINAFRRTLNW